MPPSICGDFVHSRKGLLAMGWSIITVLTAIAFVSTFMYIVINNTRYHTFAERSSYYYYDDYSYGDGQEEGQESEDKEEKENDKDEYEGDDVYYYYPIVAGVRSHGLTFAVAYTTVLSTALTIFGTTAVIGCMSPTGTFISPCFSDTSGGPSPMRLGLFIGFLFMFSNLTMLCAVVFGEFWIADNYENKKKNNMPPYSAEIHATAFSGLCMFLSILYILFTGMVFVYYDSLVEEKSEEEAEKEKKNPGFITNTLSY